MIKLLCLFLISFNLFATDFDSLEESLAKVKDYSQLTSIVAQENAAAQALLKNDAIELRVFTLNAGLLDAPFIKVPKYEERWPFLRKALSSIEFDIFCLQEVWNENERKDLVEFAKERGYYYYQGSKKNGEKHGMIILIKKWIVADTVKFDEYIYKKQKWYQPVAGYVKGVLSAKFKLYNGRQLTVLNTHLTAVANGIRDIQALEIIAKYKTGTDYLILSGDFNNNPFEKEQVYWPLINNLKLIDTLLTKYSSKDIFSFDTATNTIAGAGMAGNFGSQYRIDYIFLGRYNKDVFYYVRDTDIVFTEDLPIESCSVDGKACKLSDHYGVGAWIYLF